MPTLVIVGAQWGDEAKGKLVDVLGEQSDVVVRYSGGNNAGHTVLVGAREFKFHLIPAGILHRNVTAVLGAGMVVCPRSLLEELDRTRNQAADLGSLLISNAAHVVFPYHRMLDRLEEEARGANPIGTTSRGIGPAYQDKVGRFGIRMGELVHPQIFPERLREVLAYKNRLLEMFGAEPLDYAEVLSEFQNYADRLRPLVGDADVFVQDAVDQGKRVLFEGAQGTFLDLDSGTYPYVTSSYPTAAGACLGTGVGPRAIEAVLGVCKAYTTRVGSGPFPTELLDATGERIREVGREFGTTTGRGRRCGWLDLVLLRHSAKVNSLSGLVVTRLDVLSGFEELQIATAYRSGERTLRHVPQNTFEFAQVEPVYERMPGWEGDLRQCRRIEDLPAETRQYLQRMEDETGVLVVVASIGPDREETIFVRPERIWCSGLGTPTGSLA